MKVNAIALFGVVVVLAGSGSGILLAQELGGDAPADEITELSIGESDIWRDDDGVLNVKFDREREEAPVLEIREVREFLDHSEFQGTYDGRTVTGRFDMRTSAIESEIERERGLAQTILRIEIVGEEEVINRQIVWVEEDSAAGDIRRQSGADARHYIAANRLEVSQLMSASIKECKCSTGYIYLCPDGDCDTSEDCNNDTGICQDYIITTAR